MSTILTSLHGRQVGLDNHQRLCVPKGFRAGSPGIQTDVEGPYTRSLVDGFEGVIGALNPHRWGTFAGTTAVAFAQTAAPGAVGTLGTANTFASSGIALATAARWLPSAGELVFQTRLTLSAITGAALFAGFATGSTEGTALPIAPSGVGDGVTANDTNSVGFVFGANMAQPVLYCVSANGANVQPLTTAFTITAGVPVDLRVEVSAAGAARFYVDGEAAGDLLLQGAVNAATALTPILSAMTVVGATASTVTASYLGVSCLR